MGEPEQPGENRTKTQRTESLHSGDPVRPTCIRQPDTLLHWDIDTQTSLAQASFVHSLSKDRMKFLHLDDLAGSSACASMIISDSWACNLW